MKQKIVIRVSMNDDKCRTKAMKIAVSAPNVDSVKLTGDEKDQVEVAGDGIDSVQLTRRLRRNVAHAELVSVSEVKKEGSDDAASVVMSVVGTPYCGFPSYGFYEVVSEPACTIL